jgi:hypothetical protein
MAAQHLLGCWGLEMKKDQALKEAAEAHSNLTMFGAIQALAESGCFYGPRPHKALSRIIDICKREAQKELQRHDKASAAFPLN